MNELVKHEPAPLALSQSDSMFFNIQKFEHAQRIAKMLATSTMMPEHFRDNIGNCMILLNYADRIGADIFMLAQGMHVVHGKPGLEGKLIIGLINSSGRFEPLEFEEAGNLVRPDNDDDGCAAFAREIRSGKILKGPRVDWRTVKAEGWYDRKDKYGKYASKWRTMAPLMFRYRAAAYFGRVYCPDVLLGMQTREEILDVVEMERAGGRYVQADEPKRIERPVYEVKQAAPEADTRAEADRQVSGLPNEADAQTTAIRAEKAQTEPSGWRVGDLAYYKLGMGIGWKKVRVMGLSGETATVEFAEDYEFNGKQMRGVVSQKLVADLRLGIPEPLTREEFINLRKGFTPEYLESVRERVEETKDAKVIADLIFKAKKFFGDDYKIPGLPPEPDEHDENEEPEEPEDAPEDTQEEPEPEAESDQPQQARIGDDPERKAIKHINALINERGMEKAGVKLAMRRFVLHLKGESPIRPFDVESTTDIHPDHVKYFDGMLSEIQPQHNLLMMIQDMEKRVKGIGQFIRQKMLEWPSPVEVEHWYLLPPNAINKIKLNLDDWAKELLDTQEAAMEKF